MPRKHKKDKQQVNEAAQSSVDDTTLEVIASRLGITTVDDDDDDDVLDCMALKSLLRICLTFNGELSGIIHNYRMATHELFKEFQNDDIGSEDLQPLKRIIDTLDFIDNMEKKGVKRTSAFVTGNVLGLFQFLSPTVLIQNDLRGLNELLLAKQKNVVIIDGTWHACVSLRDYDESQVTLWLQNMQKNYEFDFKIVVLEQDHTGFVDIFLTVLSTTLTPVEIDYITRDVKLLFKSSDITFYEAFQCYFVLCSDHTTVRVISYSIDSVMLCANGPQLRFVESPSFWCHLLNELWYEVIPAIMHHYRDPLCWQQIGTRDLPGDIEYIDFPLLARELEKNSKADGFGKKLTLTTEKWLRMVKLRSMEDNDDSLQQLKLMMNVAIKLQNGDVFVPSLRGTSYSVQFVEKNSMNATYIPYRSENNIVQFPALQYAHAYMSERRQMEVDDYNRRQKKVNDQLIKEKIEQQRSSELAKNELLADEAKELAARSQAEARERERKKRKEAEARERKERKEREEAEARAQAEERERKERREREDAEARALAEAAAAAEAERQQRQQRQQRRRRSSGSSGSRGSSGSSGNTGTS